MRKSTKIAKAEKARKMADVAASPPTFEQLMALTREIPLEPTPGALRSPLPHEVDAEIRQAIFEIRQKLDGLERLLDLRAGTHPQTDRPRPLEPADHPSKKPEKANKSAGFAAGAISVERLAQFEAEPPPPPDAAPELWSDREGRKENPVDFIRRVYKPWLGKGLTRADIRQLDLPLYRALWIWLKRHRQSFHELPKRSLVIDEKIFRLSNEASPDELRKLGLALQNRARRSK